MALSKKHFIAIAADIRAEQRTNAMPPFNDWLADKLGTRKWVVAARLTERLQRDYDLALSQKKFTVLREEYDRQCISDMSPDEMRQRLWEKHGHAGRF